MVIKRESTQIERTRKRRPSNSVLNEAAKVVIILRIAIWFHFEYLFITKNLNYEN